MSIKGGSKAKVVEEQRKNGCKDRVVSTFNFHMEVSRLKK